MSLLQFLLFLHLVGSSVWVGGHLVLVTQYLPAALKNKDVNLILQFESRFEKIGVPALLLQVVSGISMAALLLPMPRWFEANNEVASTIRIKLVLLICTLGLGLHARLKIIPTLQVKNLHTLAFHIVLVTLISLLFVYFGLALR